MSDSSRKRKDKNLDESSVTKQLKLDNEAVAPVKRKLFQDDTLRPSTSIAMLTTQCESPSGTFDVSSISKVEIKYKHK